MSVTSSGWCIQHDPATTAAERSIWGKRGNLSSLRKRTVKEIQAAVQKAPEAPPLASLVPSDDAPDFATAPTVRGYLEKMAQRVQNNQLAPSQATAIAQLAKLALDLVALQNERDLIDLELEQARDREAATRPPIRILP
jgi:hypothetical protein